MKQIIHNLQFSSKNKNLIEITDKIKSLVEESNITRGLVNLSILHTTCSIIIQENADKNIENDIIEFLENLVPQDKNYNHCIEGPDDMPAHLKTMLTQTHLSLTIENNSLALGRWQGIFIMEHRLVERKRLLVCHIIGE